MNFIKMILLGQNSLGRIATKKWLLKFDFISPVENWNEIQILREKNTRNYFFDLLICVQIILKH
jgi:hypothetical protein